MVNKVETYSYKGWLNSDSFFKRTFAVMWYSIMAQVFIFFIFLLILLFVWSIWYLFSI